MYGYKIGTTRPTNCLSNVRCKPIKAIKKKTVTTTSYVP